MGVADAESLVKVRTEIAAGRALLAQLPAGMQAIYAQEGEAGMAGLTNVDARKAALARHQAASALTPEQAVMAHRQVVLQPALQAALQPALQAALDCKAAMLPVSLLLPSCLHHWQLSSCELSLAPVISDDPWQHLAAAAFSF